MVRPLRLEFDGALYHVTSRGDRRKDIYEDNHDRRFFLLLFAEVCDRYNWVCHAYCLPSDPNIRGTASAEQIKELAEEGASALPLPPKPVDKGKLN